MHIMHRYIPRQWSMLLHDFAASACLHKGLFPATMLRPCSQPRSLQLVPCSFSSFAPMHCKRSLPSACQRFMWSDTAMLEWVLYLALTLENPGVSPGSADQCTFGDNCSRIQHFKTCLRQSGCAELDLCESHFGVSL